MKYLQCIVLLATASATYGFAPLPAAARPLTNNAAFTSPKHNPSPTFLRMSDTETASASLPEIKSMRVGELKKELESYGISTKSFLEKFELVDAVEKARAEGKTPKKSTASSSSSSSSSSSASSSSSKSESSSSPSSEPTESREVRLAKEMENCKTMKAGELKKELESYGISTKSFFEKSEFVKACAEARADGAAEKKDKEGYAEYAVADVEVLTDDASGPRKRSSEGQQGQNQGGGSPFGGGMGGGAGGASPFGGGMPGGMGGMADMMKNMGGMGGGGGMPGGMGGMADMLKNMGGMGGMGGGGAGGNPFGAGGDQMKKAQELMSNPKVREIMAKAQSNPKVMKAVQECMGNPMAFAKYQNDPEIGSLIRELQQFM